MVTSLVHAFEALQQSTSNRGNCNKNSGATWIVKKRVLVSTHGLIEGASLFVDNNVGAVFGVSKEEMIGEIKKSCSCTFV